MYTYFLSFTQSVNKLSIYNIVRSDHTRGGEVLLVHAHFIAAL